MATMVRTVYGWNICRQWWHTLSYKPHDLKAIVIIVIDLIIRIIVSLSSSSSADPFDFSILWAFVRSALPSSRTLCQESLLEKRTVNHIIFIIILIIIVYYINIFKSCSLSLCFFTDQRINPICVVVMILFLRCEAHEVEFRAKLIKKTGLVSPPDLDL